MVWPHRPRSVDDGVMRKASTTFPGNENNSVLNDIHCTTEHTKTARKQTERPSDGNRKLCSTGKCRLRRASGQPRTIAPSEPLYMTEYDDMPKGHAESWQVFEKVTFSLLYCHSSTARSPTDLVGGLNDGFSYLLIHLPLCHAVLGGTFFQNAKSCTGRSGRVEKVQNFRTRVVVHETRASDLGGISREKLAHASKACSGGVMRRPVLPTKNGTSLQNLKRNAIASNGARKGIWAETIMNSLDTKAMGFASVLEIGCHVALNSAASTLTPDLFLLIHSEEQYFCDVRLFDFVRTVESIQCRAVTC